MKQWFVDDDWLNCWLVRLICDHDGKNRILYRAIGDHCDIYYATWLNACLDGWLVGDNGLCSHQWFSASSLFLSYTDMYVSRGPVTLWKKLRQSNKLKEWLIDGRQAMIMEFWLMINLSMQPRPPEESPSSSYYRASRKRLYGSKMNPPRSLSTKSDCWIWRKQTTKPSYYNVTATVTGYLPTHLLLVKFSSLSPFKVSTRTHTQVLWRIPHWNTPK